MSYTYHNNRNHNRNSNAHGTNGGHRSHSRNSSAHGYGGGHSNQSRSSNSHGGYRGNSGGQTYVWRVSWWDSRRCARQYRAFRSRTSALMFKSNIENKPFASPIYMEKWEG